MASSGTGSLLWMLFDLLNFIIDNEFRLSLEIEKKIYSIRVVKYVYTLFFLKQPVHKQLALGWQIAKQISGLNPLKQQ